MKRTYRITLVLERTFSAKATVGAEWAKDRLLSGLKESPALADWTVSKARISSSARSERAPPKLKEPEPADIELSIAKGQALASMREIAADMARILGTVKRPRIEWANNYWCEGISGGSGVAHSHNQAGVRWSRDPARAGKRAGRKIPKGLICVNPVSIVGGGRSRLRWRNGGGWYSHPANWPELMAHEIMHLRMPGGSHSREKFGVAVDRLVADYYAAKGIEPPKPAPPEPRVSFACGKCRAVSLPPISFTACLVCGAAREAGRTFEPGTPLEAIDRYLGLRNDPPLEDRELMSVLDVDDGRSNA